MKHMARARAWFEVSKSGLAELQAGKSKSFIARELIQNALDEAHEVVDFEIKWSNGLAVITVSDDSPTGFRDLRDAWTLYRPTYKRADPEKRGRFNLGEKEVLSLCKSAQVLTTTGGVIFDKRGRRTTSRSTEVGSVVTVAVPMRKMDAVNIENYVHALLVPKGITLKLHSQLRSEPGSEQELITYREPWQIRSVRALDTEIQRNGSFSRSKRNTEIHIHRELTPRLYEMGLPVCEIECDFSVNVQQKVPLSTDRETVPTKFLKRIFAETLSATVDDVTDVSDAWVRLACESPHVEPDAVKTVVRKRWGYKVAVATPGDRKGMDEALSRGFKVVYGSELSKAEWEQVRGSGSIPSTEGLFGGLERAQGEPVHITADMRRVAEVTRVIARECFNLPQVSVEFIYSKAPSLACYGSRTLTFNVQLLGRLFFTDALSVPVLDLILHELGHERGTHTEHSYHEAITQGAARAIRLALDQPDKLKRIIS